ncbi:glycosyltransferase [Martelella alba]|nr:glycosyltransferase [Martelella alba]
MNKHNINPCISIIMPVYNAEAYLDDVIKKILMQSIENFELIIVDDCSSDGTKELITRIAQEDKRIRIISNEKNENAGAARNKGLLLARGEYVIFLDDDDYVESDMLAKAYGRAKEYDADVVVFRSRSYNNITQEYTAMSWTIRNELLPAVDVFSSNDIKQNFFNAFIWWPWDKLLKKDKIFGENLKFQSIRTTNDLYFICAFMMLAKRICIVDDILISHTIQRKFSLSNTRELSYHCAIDALEALRLFMLEKDLFQQRRIDFISYANSFLEWHLNTISREPFFKLYPDVLKYLQMLHQLHVEQDEKIDEPLIERISHLSPTDFLFDLKENLMRTSDAQMANNERLEKKVRDLSEIIAAKDEVISKSRSELISLQQALQKITSLNDELQKSLAWRCILKLHKLISVLRR